MRHTLPFESDTLMIANLGETIQNCTSNINDYLRTSLEARDRKNKDP